SRSGIMETISTYTTAKGTRYKCDLSFTCEGIFYRYRQRGFPSRKAAGDWARRLELSVRNGDIPQTKKRAGTDDNPRAWTLDHVFNLLVEYWTGTLKRTTIEGYKNRYKNHISPRLGRVVFSTLTTAQVNSIPTAGRARVVLASILKHAEKIGATAPKVSFAPATPRGEGRLHFFEPDEIRRIHAALPEKHRGFFLYLIATGCRVREALGLEHGDLDYQRNLIHIRRQLCAFTGKPVTPKSGKARIIPMSALAREALSTVPCGASGVRVWQLTYWSFKEAMSEAGKATNLGKPCHAHLCRHTTAATMAAAGISMDRIAEILGHTGGGGAVTRLYSHLQPRHLAEGLDAVSAVWCR
ncbi:tyrosine-type recombinase/integrase, partial [Myxococcota bacterium]|nr:tyrosine-type recombinase/integrase [Myxococcota bacterium]